MTLGYGILRTIIGALFVGHGAQKLLGWFGGPGPDGTAQLFESVGLRPGRPNALAAGAAEAGGGALLAAGVATPLAGAALSGTMVSAIRHVHGSNGPWATDGGFEYPAVVLAAIFAIIHERSGPAAAFAQLGAGAAGSLAITELGRRYCEAQDPAESAPAPDAGESRFTRDASAVASAS